MQYGRGRVSFLASVVSEAEALICTFGGADIIDAKNPSEGALGALPAETVRRIRAAVPAHVPVSATIGDPIDDAEAVAGAAERVAATGVDIVKIGFRAGVPSLAVVDALGARAFERVRLVGVLLADDGVDLDLVARMAGAGFAGVMLDTGNKSRGALPDLLGSEELASFVSAAHQHGLFAGLAGSLQAAHVPYLLSFAPDVLGFRGGLCRAGDRTGEIDADGVAAVRRAIPLNDDPSIAACRTPHDSAIARLETESAV